MKVVIPIYVIQITFYSKFIASKSMDNYNESSSMQLNWIILGRKNVELAGNIIDIPIKQLLT
jgi:hypothetical protein